MTSAVSGGGVGTALRERLLGVVAETLDLDLSELNLDTDLLATGRLDSVAMVTLVAFLEDEAAVSITIDQLVPENFASVRRIAELATQQSTL
jgi:acyl carrier protein